MAAHPPGLVVHIVDVLQSVGPVDCKRFFGGWGLRLHSKQFGWVTRGEELYFSVDDGLREELIAEGCTPFSYAKKGGVVTTQKFYAAPSGCIDDNDDLCFWAAKAMRVGER